MVNAQFYLLSTSAGEHKWSSFFQRAFPTALSNGIPLTWFNCKDFSILGKFWHITKWTYLLSQHNWHHPAKESPVQSSGYIPICQGLLSKLSFHCNLGWCSRIRSYWWHITGKLYMISTMIKSSWLDYPSIFPGKHTDHTFWLSENVQCISADDS